MPTRGAVSIETMLCLREHLDGYPNKLLTAFRKPVVEARNQLAKDARELDPTYLDFDPKYALWVDDDAWWPGGHVDRAVRILEDHPDVDMVSGLFCRREAYAPPVIYYQRTPGSAYCERLPLLSYNPGELIPLTIAGGHWLVIRRDLLTKVGPEPFNRLPWKDANFNDSRLDDKTQDLIGQMPEDLSFCERVIRAGCKIVTGRSLLVGHVEVATGICYFPNSPAMTANGLETPLPHYGTGQDYGACRSYFSSLADDVWKADIPTFNDEAEAA
jgi:hypothetical protein